MVSRQLVSGWAASTSDPNAVLGVSIFVDDQRIGQTECALPRPDLQQLGTFGHGMHGFRFEFSEPLGRDSDKRVTVRLSATGRPLAEGDVLLHPNDSTEVLSRPTHRFIADPGPIEAPLDPRGLLEAFALLDEQAGGYDLLSRFDLERVTPRQARYLVFGNTNPPQGDHPAADQYSARDHINDLLLSDAFQTNLIPLFLKAFADKRRIIFVHVPKCAGTDLSAHLTRRFPALHQSMTDPTWMKKKDLLRALSKLALNLRFFDRVFIGGHNSLSYYAGHDLIRPSDQVFTILRDPIQIAVSQVNYIITRLTADAQTGTYAPDSKAWMRVLNIGSLPEKLPSASIQALCTTILRNPNLVQPNSMCNWLGGTDAASALAQLVTHNVEITVTDHYNDWLRHRWNISSETRLNRSEPFTSAQTMSHQDLHYLQQLCSEDIKLYGTVAEALAQRGTLAISGDDLQADLR